MSLWNQSGPLPDSSVEGSTDPSDPSPHWLRHWTNEITLVGQTGGQRERETGRRTDGRTDGQTDRTGRQMDRLEVQCYLASADPPSVGGQGLCFVLGDIGLLGSLPDQLTRRLQIGPEGGSDRSNRLGVLPGVWEGRTGYVRKQRCSAPGNIDKNQNTGHSCTQDAHR